MSFSIGALLAHGIRGLDRQNSNIAAPCPSQNPATSVSQESWTTKAERAATVFEGGEVLSEYYTFEEYIYRRGSFMGKTLQASQASKACFPRARVHAAEIYDNEQQVLPVQEVRAREIAARVDPLLPLPTTRNTQTLNDFADCPPKVATRNIAQESNIRGPSAAQAAPVDKQDTATMTGSVAQSAEELDQNRHLKAKTVRAAVDDPSSVELTFHDQEPLPTMQVNVPGYPRGTGPAVSVGNNDAVSPLSNLVHGKSSQQQQQQQHHHHQDSSGLIPPKSALTTTAQPLSTKLAPSVDQAAKKLAVPGSLNTVSQVPELSLVLTEGVAALSNRGIHVPVKEQPSRKRRLRELFQIPDAPPVPEEASATVDPYEAAAKPPPKKSKPNISEKGKREQKPEAKQKLDNKAHSEAKPKGVAVVKPKPAAKDVKARVRKSSGRDLDMVINGTALPSDSNHAVEAAKERKSRLLAKHLSVNNTTKSGRISKRRGAEPDLPPEFFNRDNFDPGRESDTVRCICGVKEDDGVQMLACENCGVWQHVECMGEAVPKNLSEESYNCQVCDPWAHRALIQQVRKKQKL